MIRILFIIFKFILGAESGASFPWSAKWQKNTIAGHTLQQLPELIDAFLLALIAMQGYRLLGLDLPFHWEAFVYLVVTAIIYAGVQSATWMFLQWEGHDNPNIERSSTTKPVVDFVAKKLGWKLGDEGYSWVAATIKGTLITLPLGGLGGILFALGYEIGSHAHGRVDRFFNAHIIAEGMSFVGIACYALIFIEICKAI
jgi:hypothetical protein